MGFVKFSSDFLMETFTLVDNLFINEHMPYCDEKQLKIYLYGLYLCGTDSANTMDKLCQTLDATEAEVISAYGYFEDMGLVQVTSTSPLEVKYLSLKRGMQIPKKYKSEKWNDFNIQLQQLYPERTIMPHEYNKYYEFLEETKLEADAMLLIVKYCLNQAGPTTLYPYIFTVARNLVIEHCRTAADVEQKLSQYDKQSEDMRNVLLALGRKSGASIEEKQLLAKWTNSWGYTVEAITAAANTLKGSKTFKKLDAKLDELYRLTIFSVDEIAAYQSHIDHLRELTVQINKNIGLFYGSIDHEVEVYTAPWVAKGFEDAALLLIAHSCMVANVHSLEGMNDIVNRFYAQGLLSAQNVEAYLRSQAEQDVKIRNILERCGCAHGVNKTDRAFYRTWTADWGFDDDVILYAAGQAVGRSYPMPYVNRLLSHYKQKGAHTVDEAKRIAPPEAAAMSAVPNFKQRTYNEEEMASLAATIEDLKGGDF